VRNGLIGRIELGQAKMAKILGGVLYMGVATRFQHPYYQVTNGDGDTEEQTDREEARILKLRDNEVKGNSDSIEAFLHEEEIELRSFQEGLLSSARAARTLRNYWAVVATLELLWYALTRRRSWPFVGGMFGLYKAKLH
jgi:hypothetical protein